MYKPLPFPDRINVWETGYEHYYHALTNKVILTYEKELMLTSIKIDKIKHWINDHCQGDTSGGVAVFVLIYIMLSMIRYSLKMTILYI